MPLFFAIAGLVSAVLALAVLSAPVLLVVLVVAAIRSARSPRIPGEQSPDGTARYSPSPDAAFAELIAGQWPAEAAALKQQGPSRMAA